MPLDLSRYLSLFVAEAGDHLDGFSRGLVALEQLVRDGAPPHQVKPQVDALFRHAHSVKGMSASMQLGGVAGLAHRAEDLVDLYRAEPSRVEAAGIDLLLAAGDALAELVDLASRGEPAEPDLALVVRLSDAVRRVKDGRDLATGELTVRSGAEPTVRADPPSPVRAERSVGTAGAESRHAPPGGAPLDSPSGAGPVVIEAEQPAETETATPYSTPTPTATPDSTPTSTSTATPDSTPTPTPTPLRRRPRPRPRRPPRHQLRSRRLPPPTPPAWRAPAPGAGSSSRWRWPRPARCRRCAPSWW
ncbi:MAG: Hpt domain-containing protein [Anaeromyxobacter sp.]|nr:Hpt domain-containing protein [Anaeromyxobacter sp.]